MDIRPARPDEAVLLSDLAIRSKAAWGYESANGRRLPRRVDRSIPPALPNGTFMSPRRDDDLLGFYALSIRSDGATGEIELMFVDPGRLRQGIGRALWRHLLDTATVPRRDSHPDRFRPVRGAVLPRHGRAAHRRGAVGQHPRPHAAAPGGGCGVERRRHSGAETNASGNPPLNPMNGFNDCRPDAIAYRRPPLSGRTARSSSADRSAPTPPVTVGDGGRWAGMKNSGARDRRRPSWGPARRKSHGGFTGEADRRTLHMAQGSRVT